MMAVLPKQSSQKQKKDADFGDQYSNGVSFLTVEGDMNRQDDRFRFNDSIRMTCRTARNASNSDLRSFHGGNTLHQKVLRVLYLTDRLTLSVSISDASEFVGTLDANKARALKSNDKHTILVNIFILYLPCVIPR
jgi:hypothetical protein